MKFTCKFRSDTVRSDVFQEMLSRSLVSLVNKSKPAIFCIYVENFKVQTTGFK